MERSEVVSGQCVIFVVDNSTLPNENLTVLSTNSSILQESTLKLEATRPCPKSKVRRVLDADMSMVL